MTWDIGIQSLNISASRSTGAVLEKMNRINGHRSHRHYSTFKMITLRRTAPMVGLKKIG